LKSYLLDWLKTEYEFQKKDFKKLTNVINYTYFITASLLLYVYGVAVFKFSFLVGFTDIAIDSLSKSIIFALFALSIANSFSSYKLMVMENTYETMISLLTALNKEYDYSINEIFKNVQQKTKFIVYCYHTVNAVSCSMVLLIIFAIFLINHMYLTVPNIIRITNENFATYLVILFMNISPVYFHFSRISKILDHKFEITTYFKLLVYFLVALAITTYFMI